MECCSLAWLSLAKAYFSGDKSRFKHSTLFDATRNFSNKLKWMWFFGNSNAPERVRVYKRNVLPFTKLPPGNIMNASHDAAEILSSYWQDSFCSQTRVPKFVHDAVKWLRVNKYSISVSDKDGVFVIMRAAELTQMLQQSITPPRYRIIEKATALQRIRTSFPFASSLVERLRRLGFEYESAEVERCFRTAPMSRFFFTASHTIKTHKPSPGVKPRIIHGSVSHGFSGFGHMLHTILMKELANVGYLAFSSLDVQSRIFGRTLFRSGVLVKLDVREFFMSGEFSQLASLASRGFSNRSLSSWVHDVSLFLLRHQFLLGENEEILSVGLGAGMGSNFAGALSDWCLHLCGEGLFVSRRSQHLVAYTRYADDIFFGAPTRAIAARLTRELIEAVSLFYEIVPDVVSEVSVPFLDLEIVVEPGRTLSYRPFIKSTARHLPLSYTSNHPSFQHMCWPRAEISRMFERSACMTDFEKFAQLKVGRFRECLMESSILRACESWTPPTPRRVLAQAPTRKLFLPVPFCSETARLFKARIREWNQRWIPIIYAAYGIRFELVIAWCRGGIPLKSRVCGLHRTRAII